MSRARNIKPGFFKNEALADLPFEYRILFQGLWCVADREGRLEDRPRRIKAEVFPYDDVDVEAGLEMLASAGFIVRYSIDEAKYIQVVAFGKHQNPHCKEAASTIPAPDKHGASTVQAPEITERAGLIPDSLNLIPDSREPNGSSPAAGSPPDCPQAEIVALYHELLPTHRRMRVWDGERAKALRARWREDAKRQSLDYWRRFFAYVAQSPFLTGQVEAKDRPPFVADLEWLVTKKNFIKVIERKYHDGVQA